MAALDRKQRVLWSDAGDIIDLSADLNSFRTGTAVMDLEGATDAIYIGCEAPFAHKFFDVKVPNDGIGAVTVELWDGSAWRAVIDIVDGTAVAGASFAQDGTISWTVDPDHSGWQQSLDSTDVEGLEDGPRVLNLYWMKLTYSGDFLPATELAYIGDLFCDDDDLETRYPDFRHQNLKTAFGGSSKVDWQEQCAAAGEEIVRELRRRDLIKRREQIIDTSLLNIPATHLAASIIYGGLGTNYVAHASRAIEHYRGTLDLNYFEVDTNQDGTIDETEKKSSTWYGTR
jgi:hypothetical protein